MHTEFFNYSRLIQTSMSLNRKIIRNRENKKLESQASDPENIRAAITMMREGLERHQQEDFSGALQKYRTALTYNPKFAEAYNAIGVALLKLGDQENALDSHRMAITLKPDHKQAHYHAGDILLSQGKFSEAAIAFQQAINLDPESVDAYNKLGQALHKQYLFQNAIKVYEAALEIDPTFGGIYHNLGLAQIMLGRRADAVETFEKATAYLPGAVHTLGYQIINKMYLCDWDNIEVLSQQIVDTVMEKKGASDPFVFQSLPTAPGNLEQFVCATNCAALNSNYKIHVLHNTVKTFSHQHLSGNRIRVGYVSMDFRPHPMAFLMTEVLEKHDREFIEVYAYSYGPPDNSPERQRFIEAADHFIDIQNMTDIEAAQRIHEDGIDILIDRKGHTYGARLDIFEHRPAPIQVNYLAFGGTMGVDFIDYAVVDAFVVPPDQQPFYTERLVYLPDTYQPNSFRPVSDNTPPRADCGLPERAFVFCGFNQTYKITRQIFDVWMRILHRTPESVLWLLKPDETTASNLRREASIRGIDPGRLVFAAKAPQAEHLARHRNADLFLDTLVVNALTTTSDSLFMGVPVLTCPGKTFVARGAGSILRALEMPELIVNSIEEYEELAVAIAANPERLRALRDKIGQKKKTAPLFNSTRYTRHLDAAYREMWRLHLAGEGPKPFAVAPFSKN